jgi:hypothetical protein
MENLKQTAFFPPRAPGKMLASLQLKCVETKFKASSLGFECNLPTISPSNKANNEHAGQL